jgi:hypothetical protein
MVLTILLGIGIAIMAAVVLYLVGSLIWAIRRERRNSGVRKIWANFALSLAFCFLFFTSWAAQGMTQWREFVTEQREHGEAPAVSDFLAQFSARTLENWQSEFLQLFSFVVLAALYIHRGSAESRDSDDRMEQALQRIEKRLEESKS